MQGYQVLIIIAAIIFFMAIWGFAYDHKTIKSGKGLIDEEPPVVERYATVIEKYPEEKWTGTRTPRYNFGYKVKFKDDNGEIISVSVPPEIYEDIPVGLRDVLITQNNNFYDFGGRYGQNIPEDEQNQ